MRVQVLVDLPRTSDAGGHVKCWEHFAQAAVNVPWLDLTVHFLGDTATTEELNPNVRFVTHLPVLSTKRLGLRGMPAVTDLAPRNPRLEERLLQSDVLHTTDTFFAMARAARRVSRRAGIPLVTSVHTDIPKYSPIFAAEACRQIPFGAWMGGILIRWLHVPDFCGRIMSWQLRRYFRACDWVLHARPEEVQPWTGASPEHVSRLRRGIDRNIFHPKRRNRRLLVDVYRLPPKRFVILYTGRIDDAKNVLTLARAARRLLDGNAPVHVLMVGQGSRVKTIQRLLREAVTFAGVVPQSTLAWIYASADVLAFPSRTEVFPNVIVESKASGLPVLVSTEGGSARLVERTGEDGLLLEDDPAAWARAIDELRLRPDRLQHMRKEARKSIVSGWPSWEDVLAEDLLPVWREVGARRRPASPPQTGFTHAEAASESAP